jgi:hypothetical protein
MLRATKVASPFLTRRASSAALAAENRFKMATAAENRFQSKDP